MTNIVHLCDCMEFMAGLDDGHFSLAIVDPPYGIFSEKKGTGFIRGYDTQAGANSWDKRPPKEYFDQLFRISQQQIIWGAQYFADYLPAFSQLIIWDKATGASSFADGEAAYCSIPGTLRIFRHQWCGVFKASERGQSSGHPTQKPVALYRWLLQKYALPGDTIFDSHVGSGSSRIACYDMGYSFTGCEIDPDYHAGQEARYRAHAAQGRLFEPEEFVMAQGVLFDHMPGAGKKETP